MNAPLYHVSSTAYRAGIDESELRESQEGYEYLPRPLGSECLELVARDLPAPDEVSPQSDPACNSSLVITLEDGTVLTDEQAFDFIERHAPRTDVE